VHLEDWPTGGKIDKKVLKDMETARAIASKGLEARMIAKINVRQPLGTMSTTSAALEPGFISLIKDEVNVKEIVFGAPIKTNIALDTNITPALKEEGDLRELLRNIQDLRKEKGLSVSDPAVLTATDDLKDLISRHEKEIKAATHLTEIKFGDSLELKA
jgi:isoleucyl-tRNA synthetase